MISSGYDYQHNHFRFMREHTGDAPERSAPVHGWGVELLRLAGVAIFCLALLLVLVGSIP